jgi:hypothetical protein
MNKGAQRCVGSGDVSADDLWIYLGENYDHGFFPMQLRFTVRDGERVTRGHFLDPAHVNVGGRMSPYIVPLRAGSSLEDQTPLRSLFEDAVPRRPVLLSVEWDGRPSGWLRPDGTIYPETDLPVWPGHLVSSSLSLGPRRN